MVLKIKVKKKSIINASLSLVLLVSILFTSVFCFLQTSESFTNIVTLGDIDIRLVEEGWEKVTDTGSANFGSYVRTDGASFNTTPNDAIEKAPYILNKGVNDVRAFIVVKVPTITEAEFFNTSLYLDTYGNKYDVKVTAIGIQDGMYRDDLDNPINTPEDIWDNYMGDNNAFFDEVKTTEERKEFINMNDLDIGEEGSWTEVTVFKGKKHNFHVYGYKESLTGSKTLERELKTLTPETDQERIDEINTILASDEYSRTTPVFQSLQLNNLFGTGPNISVRPKPLGGCLFYIDTEPKTYTNRNGETITINPGEDEDGHPYIYTFYDEHNEELTGEEIYAGNHKIVGYTVNIPQYYEDALAAGTITQEEYDAVPSAPVWDKYFVVAAQDNADKNNYTLYYGNTNLTASLSQASYLKYATSRTAMSPAYYALDVYVKDFLIENNLVDRYYDVSGDVWTLKATAHDSNKLIGMGKYNTKFIYEMYGTSNTSLFASNCVYYTLKLFNDDTIAKRNKTGCYDWYVPSIDELFAITEVYKSPNAKFTFSEAVWSSSEAKGTDNGPANMYYADNTLALKYLLGSDVFTFKMNFVRSF